MIVSLFLSVSFVVLIDFSVLAQPCIPKMNPLWSWCLMLSRVAGVGLPVMC